MYNITKWPFTDKVSQALIIFLKCFYILTKNYFHQRNGKGLGKDETGISKPLKCGLKFNKMGIGYQDKLSEETTNRWWEQAYNKAASNITSTGTSKEESGFDASAFAKLTDEELFKACGGRTAHKAARHGLHLGGKLERIEHQEKKSTDKRKKSKKTPSESCDEIVEERAECREEKSLDKKRKKRKITSGECPEDEKTDTMSNEPSAKKKKRKSAKKCESNHSGDKSSN